MNRFHTKPSLFCLGGIYIRRKGFLRTLAVNRDNQGYLLTCYKPCFFWHAGLSLAMFEGCNVHVGGYWIGIFYGLKHAQQLWAYVPKYPKLDIDLGSQILTARSRAAQSVCWFRPSYMTRSALRVAGGLAWLLLLVANHATLKSTTNGFLRKSPRWFIEGNIYSKPSSFIIMSLFNRQKT